MNLLKLDVIEAYFLALATAILGFFLFYPDSGVKIGNSVLSSRIFTNIVVGGDIIEPEIATPGPFIPAPIVMPPIVAPIPSITPIPAPTPSVTNSSTNFPATNSVINTNN
jgi:hypothetical protein